MIYESLLDQRLALFQQSPVILWGDLDCIFLLEEKLRNSAVPILGCVIDSQVEKTSFHDKTSLKQVSSQELMELAQQGNKPLIQLAFSPFFSAI